MANERARHLRKNMTGPERKLWRELSRRAAGGLRFRRQHPIGPYIADFVCLDKRLIVEVDGETHALDEQIEHDKRRSAWLEGEGYRVIRFWSNEVNENIGGVVETIMHEAGVL